jgi:hypothetical protein
VNQKMEILLLIKVEKVVWMEFVGIFHQVSKSYNVSYSYKGRSLRLSGNNNEYLFLREILRHTGGSNKNSIILRRSRDGIYS